MSQNQCQQWLPHNKSTNLFEAPNIIGYNPKQGYIGDAFSICIALSALNSTLIRISFGSCIVPTHFVVNTDEQTVSFHSCIPIHSSASSSNVNKVPIYLAIIREGSEKDIDVLDSWFAGYFFYDSKRRKEDIDSNTKRTKIADLQLNREYMPTYYHLNYMGLPSSLSQSSRVDGMDAAAQMLTYPNYKSPNSGVLQFSNDNTPSNFMIPILPNNNPIRSPIIPSSPHPSPLPSCLYSVQTQHPIAPATTTQGPRTVGPEDISTDPFVNILHNAILTFENGDLMEMTKNWTEAEMKAKRRLVQFWRRQEGTKALSTQFNPYRVKRPGDPPDFVASCIYWEEKKEWYLTSVDCISLLEFLIGVIFTTEEKNRVRRNLERFEPETISKHKDSTYGFFKLIMAFPKPRPRNIEKDIKVFKWEHLAEVLEKVIHRFAASYSTTLSIITDGEHVDRQVKEEP